jgi:hypothetical protein
MTYQGLRGVAVACGVAVSMLSTPSESQAIFHWFRNWSGNSAVVPAYSYYGGLGACDPCGPQVCNYVPQTCYRTQYVSVPVTTYRPIAGCDPCTGCPVTTYRPITAYVWQPRLVPYSSFRLVYSGAAYGSAMYGGGCAAGGCPAVSTGYYAATAVPSCCSPASTAITTPYLSPTAPSPGSWTVPGPSSAPAYPSSSAPPPTFQNGSGQSGPEPEKKMPPIPDEKTDQDSPPASDSNPTSGPQLGDSESKMTAAPPLRAWSYTLVSWPPRVPRAHVPGYSGSATPIQQNASPRLVPRQSPPDSGWRASSR